MTVDAGIRQDDDDGERELSEVELLKEVTLKLSETNTMWLLDMPSICVMSDSDEASEIVRQKSRYEEVTNFLENLKLYGIMSLV